MQFAFSVRALSFDKACEIATTVAKTYFGDHEHRVEPCWAEANVQLTLSGSADATMVETKFVAVLLKKVKSE